MNRPGPMRNFILLRQLHFGKGFGIILGLENRVVPKAFIAFWSFGNAAFHLALKSIHPALLHKRYYGSKTGCPLALALHFVKQLIDIIGERAIGTGVPGGIHSGTVIERFYFQTGVIGKAADSVFGIDVVCLLNGIPLQGIMGLRDIFRNPFFLKAPDLKAVAQSLTYLFQFMSIVARQYQFHGVKIKKLSQKQVRFRNSSMSYSGMNYPPEVLKLPPSLGGFGLMQITGNFSLLAMIYCS